MIRYNDIAISLYFMTDIISYFCDTQPYCFTCSLYQRLVRKRVDANLEGIIIKILFLFIP